MFLLAVELRLSSARGMSRQNKTLAIKKKDEVQRSKEGSIDVVV
jgi:hypothetical protein